MPRPFGSMDRKWAITRAVTSRSNLRLRLTLKRAAIGSPFGSKIDRIPNSHVAFGCQHSLRKVMVAGITEPLRSENSFVRSGQASGRSAIVFRIAGHRTASGQADFEWCSDLFKDGAGPGLLARRVSDSPIR